MYLLQFTSNGRYFILLHFWILQRIIGEYFMHNLSNNEHFSIMFEQNLHISTNSS